MRLRHTMIFRLESRERIFRVYELCPYELPYESRSWCSCYLGTVRLLALGTA